MEHQFSAEVLMKLKQKRRKRLWKRILSVMMCLVVFCTTYALILPAITKETETFCGKEAHTHTNECFPQRGALICGFSEESGHVHSEECVPMTGYLPQCGLEEAAGHIHTEECELVEEQVLFCRQEESEGHIHTAACQPQEENVLVCDLEETVAHTHTEQCSAAEFVLSCGLEETEGHTHANDCFTVILVCGLMEDESHTHAETCYAAWLNCAQEEAADHVHMDSCFTILLGCGLAEDETHNHAETCYTAYLNCGYGGVAAHSHSDSCYKEVVEMVCGLEETEGHVHSDQCYAIVSTGGCGLEEMPAHTHTDACYTIELAYSCGMEETGVHTHTESCYTTYSCGLEAVTDHVHTDACYESTRISTLEESEEHTHGTACYNVSPLCEQEEHVHERICYSNPNADLETASMWEAGLPELSGDYVTDVLAIANSQLGYAESTRNYQVEEDVLLGYTRYGAWYGYPYGDWCAMFVSFCLNYAEVEDFPLEASCPNWAKKLIEQELYKVPSEYIPKAGDIIFFDMDEDEVLDHVGLVEELVDIEITTIEGNSSDRVEKKKYELHDSRIAGYGLFSEYQSMRDEISEPADSEETPFVPPEDLIAWVAAVDENGQIVSKESAELPEEAPAEEELEDASLFARFAAASPFGLRLMSETQQNTARASASLNLTPFITGVTMLDENNKEIPNGTTVTEGDQIRFKIEYTIPGQQLGLMDGQTISNKINTVTYQLPRNIHVAKSSTGNITDPHDVTDVEGTYIIDAENRTITLIYNDDIVEENAKGTQHNGSIAVDAVVEKITEEDDEHQNFAFTDKITLGIQIKEEIEVVGDISLKKEAAKIVGEDILYEVTIESVEGTTGPITITDTMSEGLTFNADEGVSVKRGTGVSVSNVEVVSADDGRSFTMELPQMARGEKYTIKYWCTADIDLLDKNMTVSNTASVTGKDSQNNDLRAEFTVDHTFELLKKTGQKNDDGTITWTITINRAKADISGWTLEDELGDQQYTGTVIIKDSGGNTVANNVTLPYTFPNGSTDTYTITYTTSQELGIKNTAILKKKDTEISEVKFVDVGSPFTKVGVAGEPFQDEGNYLLPITWTVTIDATYVGFPGGSVFKDIMKGWEISYADEMYMTYDQLMAAVNNFNNAMSSIDRAGRGEISAWVYEPGTEASDEKYTYSELISHHNDCHLKKFDRFEIKLSDGGIPKQNKVTFSYEAYGVFPNQIVSTSTFVNRFSLAGQYEVEVPVEYQAGDVVATKHAVVGYDPDQDRQIWNFVGTEGTSWGSYEALRDDYLAWVIELKVIPPYTGTGDVVLYEDLPDGVSVKGLDWYFLSDVPTERLALRDMAPGKTDTWDIVVYPADQYKGYGQPQGGQAVSIEVKVTEAGDLEMTIPGIIFRTMADKMELDQLTEWFSHLYIYTQINDDVEWTPQSENPQVHVSAFENRFTLKNDDGDVIDIGSQTQVIERDESEGVVRKYGSVDENNNIITYSVVLNAYGRDLIEGADTLQIQDELSYTSTPEQPIHLNPVTGSVKLYEIRLHSDGDYTILNEVPTEYRFGKTSSVQGEATTWVHTIDLEVPDGKSLLLQYSYVASGNKNVTCNVLNTCAITGVGQSDIEGNKTIQIQVQDSTATLEGEGVSIYKVDSANYGVCLPNAVFNIYIWNDDQKQYIKVHNAEGNEDFVTNKLGKIVLSNGTMGKNEFAYNTAYYLVEKQSPNGYYLGPEKYYFYIAHANEKDFEPCMPTGFRDYATSLVNGDIIHRENVRNSTEISVEKYWEDFNGATKIVTGEEVSSITLELWRRLEDDPDSDELYGTYEMTPNEEGKWSLTIIDLPKATQNPDGTQPDVNERINYLYYFKEVAVNGYALDASQNNEGINSGTIILVNRETEGYVLPETGGAGTQLYTAAGLLLMLTSAAYLMYNHKKRRKEVA